MWWGERGAVMWGRLAVRGVLQTWCYSRGGSGMGCMEAVAAVV